jgi:pentatricopeptide repeat protein
LISKPNFTAALKRAQELQGTYKIEVSRADALYDELKGEDETSVLDALKRLGKTDKAISYFNIMEIMNEGYVNTWKDTAPTYEPMPDEAREAIEKLKEKFNR